MDGPYQKAHPALCFMHGSHGLYKNYKNQTIFPYFRIKLVPWQQYNNEQICKLNLMGVKFFAVTSSSSYYTLIIYITTLIIHINTLIIHLTYKSWYSHTYRHMINFQNHIFGNFATHKSLSRIFITTPLLLAPNK